MRSAIAGLAIVACICGGVARAHADAGWVFPGEYESHQAIWMLWPTLEYKAGASPVDTVSEMLHALEGHVHVNLGVQDAADEQRARADLTVRGVSLDHVHFYPIPHFDMWARDMGPQFTRSANGQLRITDWSFNMWGHEDPDSESSAFEEEVDRTVSEVVGFEIVRTRKGPKTGVRMIHEGGAPTHNGRGTAIIAESVVIQRNLGPGRFCGGQAPVTDYEQPNTYAPNPDWAACKKLVEEEFRRMLGVVKLIWVPTGVVEDNGTFRGPLATQFHVSELDGQTVDHAGVYTVFTTNGHLDEVVRFVSPRAVVLAQEKVATNRPRTEAGRLQRWLQQENAKRLERIAEILSQQTNESGEPIEIFRIPTPEHTLEVFTEGDATYDYFAAYEHWEDGSTFPVAAPSEPAKGMLAVWASSYVNYVPTNDLVLVSRFGGSQESVRRDQEAAKVLRKLFPGREVIGVATANVNRGGGGMNCITQQQPASAKFAQRCGWAKVQVASGETPLFLEPRGTAARGQVKRSTQQGEDIYLQRLNAQNQRTHVRVTSGPLRDQTGWVDTHAIESAGEKCMDVYVAN